MSSLFGFDPGELIRSIGGALHSLVPAPRQQDRMDLARDVAGRGASTPPLVLRPVPVPDVRGSGFALGPGGGGSTRALLPAPEVPGGDLGPGFRPGGGGLGDFGGLGHDPMDIFPALAKEEARQKGIAARNASSISGGGAALNFGGPATSDDNKALTAQKVEAWIANTRANSPLRGMGGYILSEANRLGISAPLMLAIMLKESELGTTGPLAGVTAAGDGGLGGQRKFASYDSVKSAIDGALGNLAGSTYKGKSVAEQVGAWYVGPDEYAKYGLAATDHAGNGTVADYLDLVSQVYRSLGVGFDPQGRPSARAAAPTGARGVSAVWGGTGARPITQDFGNTDFSAGNPIYDYGADYGVSGHTGIDIGMAAGSQVWLPVGGVVEIAGGTKFYRDEDENPSPISRPQEGELRIRLDNGDIVILGHMRHIDLKKDQRVNAGDFAGLSGSANGGHVHLEVRVKDSSLPSGYRIVNPQTYFGGGR